MSGRGTTPARSCRRLDLATVGLEVQVVDRVESDEGGEEAHVRERDLRVRVQVARLAQDAPSRRSKPSNSL